MQLSFEAVHIAVILRLTMTATYTKAYFHRSLNVCKKEIMIYRMKSLEIDSFRTRGGPVIEFAPLALIRKKMLAEGLNPANPWRFVISSGRRSGITRPKYLDGA